MLRLDGHLDLGLDHDRMTDDDKRRQEATVDRLLRAFSGPMSERREIQLLADEVGLGKTFVALATAYSLLNIVRTQPRIAEEADLGGCYRSVVVVVPSGNHALARKWNQEVEALRTRCSKDSNQTAWFQSRICDNAYDLVDGLRRSSDLRRTNQRNPCVLICTANVFSRKIPDLGERLRFLAGCLFRWWGNRLSKRERFRIIARAAEVHGFSDWAADARRAATGDYDVDLWDFREHEEFLSPSSRRRFDWPDDLVRRYEQVPFSYAEIATALDALNRTDEGHAMLDESACVIREGFEEPSGLLPYCKDAARRRGHAGWYFQGFKSRLLELYKELAVRLFRRDLPLVIVDEAHHWRHSHRKDCQSFRMRIAPVARRLLLLTATPFQLHRDELLEVLAAGDAMEAAIGADRVNYLRRLRDRIRDATAGSEESGRMFSREWGTLSEQFARVDARLDAAQGILPETSDPRTEVLARLWTVVAAAPSTNEQAWQERVPAPLRSFFAQALELRRSNERLRTAMGVLVVRHRRPVGHRRVLIGREYPMASDAVGRPDQHLLHLAPGATIPPHAELAQYLLMKVVADVSRGKHRTTLGMDLTGCYTTLWESREGAKAVEAATKGSSLQLFRLLQQVTGYRDNGPNTEDGRHPKLQLVLNETLRRWEHGEKTLIFCFRVPTARTLATLISEGVKERLQRSRHELMKSRGTKITTPADVDRAMQQFRRSLTTRDGSGVPLFLDRVLTGWFLRCGLSPPTLSDYDRESVAWLYARARTESGPLLRGKDRLRLDRVFLNRAIEHVWARRLLCQQAAWRTDVSSDHRETTSSLLEQMANEDWVRFRYGRPELSRGKVDTESHPGQTDSGVRSSLSAWYELDESATANSTAPFLALLAKEQDGRPSVLDTVVSGPNLFVPLKVSAELLGDAGRMRAGRMRNLLFQLESDGDFWEWTERAKVMDAVVRALLREDILLRLPGSVFKESDETWAASILRGLHEPPGGDQFEPLAGRVEEFLRELVEMGPTERDAHLRYAMNARAEGVVLVTGDSGVDRDAVFNGFNTPLLPDILVCTQVGQEGIDLHRHCRHVVHFDLGWNPATLEQRTGRVDRLGSKAMRERNLAILARQAELDPSAILRNLPGLDIALPYLAGTYDERMYDRLRSRAQTFEILTGGDPSADRDTDSSWLDPDDHGNAQGISYVPLPNTMLEELRVNLAV